MATYNISTSANSGSAGAEQANVYPRSRVSQSNHSESVVRSRTWSEDITKNWNEQITGLETLGERVNRYMLYFTLTTDQLKVLADRMITDMRQGVEAHLKAPDSSALRLSDFPTAPVGTITASANPIPAASSRSLRMLDTFIPESALPKGNEVGTVVALDFSSTEIMAAKVQLEGNKRITFKPSASLNLRGKLTDKYPQGLLDKKSTATELFDTLCDTVNAVVKEANMTSTTGALPLGVCFGFPCEQRGVDSATLVHWCKGFQTGRESDDPVEGMDIGALLDCAMWRSEGKCKTRALLNDSAAMLLSVAYELPAKLPAVRTALVVGNGINGCYIAPDSSQFMYRGDVINCELGDFDKALPLNDVDLEVDFADPVCQGRQLFEKMVASAHLGELCRRLIVKVWQNEAPPLAWVRYSIPWLACARVLEDTEDPDLSITAEILTGLWEWNTTVDERRTVQRLFEVVFSRSAALAAVAAVSLASSSGRLQAAMGGLTCAIGGTLLRSVPLYGTRMRKYLDSILDPEIARLIHFQETEFGPLKGAAILAAANSRKR